MTRLISDAASHSRRDAGDTVTAGWKKLQKSLDKYYLSDINPLYMTTFTFLVAEALLVVCLERFLGIIGTRS